MSEQTAQDPVDEPVACPGRATGRLTGLVATMWTYRRLWFATRRICHPDAEVRTNARAKLLASPDQSRRILRKIAFRTRSRLAYGAAEILYEMNDVQGLYALLSQYSDRYMFAYFSEALRQTLHRVGAQEIIGVLESCLDRLEEPLPHDHWSLSLSVYALNALVALRATVPDPLWRRALSVSCPGFEDLRSCRTVVPLLNEPNAGPLTANDPRVGKTLVAVRRASVDALLRLAPDHAFELLVDAMNCSDIQVRLTAIYGLRRLKDRRAYVLLQPIAASRRDPLCRDAKRAIEALGSSQPDVLTLVRPSVQGGLVPNELLRPASGADGSPPDQLLRPTSPE